MDTVAKLVSVAYPLGDILLLAAAIRLAVDSGRRQPAFYLLAASILALLATDFVYGVMTLNASYDGQVVLDVGWISFYLLWGAAALHPTMSDLERPRRARDVKLTPFRLLLLTGASLIAPVVEATQELGDGDVDLMVVIGASGVLFALVVARMAGLVRQQERSVARERAVGAAGVELVAATGLQDIHRAALTGATSLIGPAAAALVCAVDGDRAGVVASAGTSAPDGSRWPIGPARTSALLAAADDDRIAGVELDAGWREELRLEPGHTHAYVLGLELRGATHGLLVVAGLPSDLRPVVGSLQALASQVSLALESAALSEEVHRRTSEARFGSLVKHSSDLITVVDADGIVVYQSPSIERVLGYTPEELTGTRFEWLLDGAENSRLLHLLADASSSAAHGVDVFECSLRHSDGGTRQFEIQQANLLHDEHVRGIVLNSRDVSERKAFEQQLQHQAFHDPVTGLANRALFGERVRHAVARTRREHIGLSVLFIDLDDFKTINDSLGHAAGDEVLRAVSQRLDGSIRASDTAARFGGDEFAVLLEGIESAQEAADTAERILEALAQPLTLEHNELVTRASMGISVVEGAAAADAEEMIRNADAAMYIAKRDGKGGYRLFEPAMHEGVLARLELRADLQRALASDQLELHYQPVVRLGDGRPSGVEALLRWRHPERGLVPPGEFIPFAEEMGLIVPIGRWVLREGCRQAVRMQKLLPSDPPLTMAVNLSVKQLQHSDIVGDVREALADSGLEPGRLTLEITETVMMTDTALVVARLKELKELGVRLAMDDFGTGYSSLSYLSKFPVDILKMDRSFLREDAPAETAGLATAVVSLGDTLDLEVVAEGIELPEQWSTLRDLGCDLGQGYFFARPMDAEGTLDFLRAQREAAAVTPGEVSHAGPPRADGP
jgi:diguanylate cyclase (GGDEF)-like protein/PAS domain S-box-containing protein